MSDQTLSQQSIKIATKVITSNAEHCELLELKLDSEVLHRLAKEFSANPNLSFLKQIDHDWGMFAGELELMRNSCQSTLDDDELDILTSLEILELENTIKECESLLNKLGLD